MKKSELLERIKLLESRVLLLEAKLSSLTVEEQYKYYNPPPWTNTCDNSNLKVPTK